jgi:hypothetical protein
MYPILREALEMANKFLKAVLFIESLEDFAIADLENPPDPYKLSL